MLVPHCKLGDDERTCGVDIHKDGFFDCDRDCKHFELIPTDELRLFEKEALEGPTKIFTEVSKKEKEEEVKMVNRWWKYWKKRGLLKGVNYERNKITSNLQKYRSG